jgi:hypothetical protein
VSATASNLALFSLRLNDVTADLQQVLLTNKTEFADAVKNIESSSQMMKSLLSELQAGKGLAGSLLKNEELSASVSQLVNNLNVLSSNLSRHGLLWKPRKTEAKQPSPLYPGRDPWR